MTEAENGYWSGRWHKGEPLDLSFLRRQESTEQDGQLVCPCCILKMKRNVEIKARLADAAPLRERVEQIADEGPAVIEQEDTFFKCEHGRLKLRKSSESRAELIYYDRPDSAAPTECRYVICPTSEPALLGETLSRAAGVKGTVRKRRTVYMVGQTRVHLDQVDGLGEFVELEVVLAPEQSAFDGKRIADRLMDRLGIKQSDLIETAYIDLLDGTRVK